MVAAAQRAPPISSKDMIAEVTAAVRQKQSKAAQSNEATRRELAEVSPAANNAKVSQDPTPPPVS